MINLINLLYIDPAATSILLTSISGIAIAIGATAVILWRKFKKKASKVLKIDENANKEVEDEIVLTEDNGEEAVKEETIETHEESIAEEKINEEK